ncbi:MAG TPA: hypothetical protein VI914_06700 [Thermodesulfobacteriota bacterium]|nr:hypothetical protein [Thermodesulfobacteriota bacterium]
MVTFGWGFSTTLIMALLIFFLIAVGVLTVLWIILPFSVYGIKDILKEVREEAKKTNRLLEEVLTKTPSVKDKPPESKEHE